MAAIDLTRKKNYQEKRVLSTSAGRFTFDQATGVLADNYIMFKIPADCIVIRGMINVLTASQATVTASLGFAGGTELMATQTVAAVAVKDSGVKALVTGTGKDLTIKFGTAIPTVGEFEIVVEYYEPTTGTNIRTITS